LAYPIACGVALLATVAAYGNHFHNDFHFDDSHTILNNAYIRSLHNIPVFFTSTATFSSLPANQSYRPLVTTTLALDYWWGGGLNTFAFHVTSFSLFLLQSVLMLVFYRRVMDRARPADGNRWLALVAAAWYALHPVNAETVNYVIARSEILSTIGILAGLLLFARGGMSKRYHLYLVPVVLAILSRESGAMFAPLLFLYVALVEQQISLGDLFTRKALADVLRATLPAFLVCAATVTFGLRMATTYSPGGTSAWRYLLTEPFVLLYYVYSLFVPLHLSADTRWPLVASALDPRVLAGGVFIAASIGLAWVSSRRRDTRPIAFGVLWFFVALLPTSSIVPLAEPMNDHRMFFPFVGLILAVVWAVGLLVQPLSARRRMAAASLAIVCLAAMGYGTRQRNIVWRSEESLWLDATIKSPDNGRGLMNYGVIQMGKGNYRVADEYFERALQLTPRYAYVHVNLGVLKAALGQRVEAERHFREAMQDDPNNPVSYTHFARWLASIGRTEEARLLAERALELSPADVDARTLLTELRAHAAAAPAAPTPSTPEAWLALGAAQARSGLYENAIRSSERALALKPDSAEAFNDICAAEIALGNFATAVDACEHALVLQPGSAEARKNLAAAKAKVAR
jgi:Flp pilus assembly protein TadD